MDALYQARVKRSETDLLIDQLKETLHYLTVQNKVGQLQSAASHAYTALLLIRCSASLLLA